MKAVVLLELRRVLNKYTLGIFFGIILLFSINSSFQGLNRYVVPDESGIAITSKENLTFIREHSQGKELLNYVYHIKERDSGAIYADQANLESIVFLNYGGKGLASLTNNEIDNFYKRRIANIQETLEQNSRITYTENEKKDIMKRASHLFVLFMDYAEGWKVLNKDMGGFVALILFIIPFFLIPLIGNELQTNMKELCRSTGYGKQKLDLARIMTAYMGGIMLYLMGVFLYAIIKMIPFGFEGGNQLIQTNVDTFFSIYNITYLQQFFINVFIGFLALIFIISLALFVVILLEGTMTSIAILIFFWISLLLIEQMVQYPVNHWFANFMPLRMTNFRHYYTDNEIYRIFGITMLSMKWVAMFSTFISSVILAISIFISNIKLRRGLN